MLEEIILSFLLVVPILRNSSGEERERGEEAMSLGVIREEGGEGLYRLRGEPLAPMRLPPLWMAARVRARGVAGAPLLGPPLAHLH